MTVSFSSRTATAASSAVARRTSAPSTIKTSAANVSVSCTEDEQKKEDEKKREGRWGTLRKEGAPTALHLTPFRIVLSQSDARYPYGLGDGCFVLFVYNFFVPSWNGFCHILIPA